MSQGSGRGPPPVETRFRKGESGNPKGRPRRAPQPTSAFDIIMEKSLTVVQGGRARELSVDEALQQKTYQEAIAGSRPARREILRMIARREQALAERRPRQSVEVRHEGPDPANADEALLILGIATRDTRRTNAGKTEGWLLLERWAVKAALLRRRRTPLSKSEISSVRCSTRDGESLTLPEASGT